MTTSYLRATAPLLLGVLLGGCAAGGTSAADARPEAAANDPFLAQVTTRPAPSPTPAPAPTCREVRQGLKVTYTIRRVPTPHGPQFRVALTVDNTLDWIFGGLIFGGFDLTGVPGNRNDGQYYGWGGSSVDTLQPEPLTRRTTRVWAGGTPEGVVVPSDTQIVGLDLNTSISVPRRPHAIYSKWVHHCSMPARVRAPRGLVAGHPAGHWTESAPRRD